MTHATTARAASFAIAAVMTLATFLGADAMAHREFVAADQVAQARLPVLALQSVTVVGHVHAKA